MEIIFRKTNPHQRLRGNKIAGRIWLIVIFLCLAAINVGVSVAVPYIGSYASFFKAALFVDTIWAAVLLAAIWNRQGWARGVLAAFLLGFVAMQFLYWPVVIQDYPMFRETSMEIVLLHWATHILIAIYLLVSVDIAWLSRDEMNE